MPADWLEIREVARSRGKNHRPRHIGRAAPELAVDEICEPSQQLTNRHRRGAQVHGRQEARVVPLGKHVNGEPTCKQGAVEGHASVPEAENFKWIAVVGARLVQQYLPEPTTNNHADCHIEEQVVDCGRRKWWRSIPPTL